MQRIEINLDVGGMRPIICAFEDHDYYQDFDVILNHQPRKRVNVEKYPLLCSIVNEIRNLGHTCNIQLNCADTCSQLNYAERMGFLSFLGIDFDYGGNRRAGGGRFIELTNLTRIFYPGDEMMSVFENSFNFSHDEALDVALIISELVNNSVMHSEGSGGSMLYCQKYPSQNYLNLFIVDSGIGIYQAMQSHSRYDSLDELEVLSKSLEFGEGNGKGYGQGLYLVSQFIKRNFGYLRLVSGNYNYLVSSGNESFLNNETNYKGVILHLKLPFDIEVTMQEIMDEKLI
jgi:anti-sigma regulatory factor (Ser/Thr protein kinase)